MIHLDTNFLIGALVGGSAADRQLRTWLAAGEPIGTSAIVWTEFLCGPLEEASIGFAARLIPNPEPYTATDAAMAARLFNANGRRRGTLIDCMIAAIAIRTAAPLASFNQTDFRRFEAHGLTLVPMA